MTTHDERLDHTPLTFGKYKGKTPSQIADINPSYIVWLWENVEGPKHCSKLLYNDCQIDTEQDNEDDY